VWCNVECILTHHTLLIPLVLVVILVLLVIVVVLMNGSRHMFCDGGGVMVTAPSLPTPMVDGSDTQQ